MIVAFADASGLLRRKQFFFVFLKTIIIDTIRILFIITERTFRNNIVWHALENLIQTKPLIKP